MDEDDDEPFSAQASAIISTPSKQDEFPKRPAPGGRFPSEISLSRGLQAPLSPSSGSSNFEDRRLVPAAGTLPASNVSNDGQEVAVSPTHAAYVNQQTRQDGLDPYTSQPMGQDSSHDLEEVVVAGVGGAGLGALGAEAYHHDENEISEKQRQEQKEHAAREAALIAAPDTYEQESEALAAREAAAFAAPDVDLVSAPADYPNFMVGDRSQGGLTSNEGVSAGNAYAEIIPAKSADGRPIEAALRPLTDDPVLRPSLAAGQNHQSVQSVSQLHVPGGFPKENAKTQTPLSLV